VPRWIVLLGSVVIVAHLGSVLANVLAAPSGPWPAPPPQGVYQAEPPRLALAVAEPAGRWYLGPLKLWSNYHFRSNSRLEFQASLEVRLEDEAGKPVKTVKFPDPRASRRLQHWQRLAATWLVPDEPVMRRPGEEIAAPGKKVPEVPVWGSPDNDPARLRLEYKPENLLPHDQPSMRPSEWSMIFIRSYVRYLCRTHGAARAEVVRHSRAAVPPQILFEREVPPAPDRDLESSYGRLPR
jgi:hypothetical protein